MHCFIGATITSLCAQCARPHIDPQHYAGVAQLYPETPPERVLTCEVCKDPTQHNGPSHDPSPNCLSGKRPHCSCDTCF